MLVEMTRQRNSVVNVHCVALVYVAHEGTDALEDRQKEKEQSGVKVVRERSGALLLHH